jgi:uncharacterized protein
MDTTLFWLCAAIATFVAGASKGGVPGVGILAVPILAQAIPAGAAAGFLLPLYVISDMYGLWLYRKDFDFWNIQIMVLTGCVGIGIGWATAHYNNDDIVKLMVGIIGIWYTADLYFHRKKDVVAKPADIPRGFFWGTIAGFTSFVAHAGGIPFQMYVLPQRLGKMKYAGTSTITFAIINALKLPPYWMLNQINLVSLEKCAYLAPMALFGAWAGFRLTKILREKPFFKAVEIALLLVSLKLIYDALTHMF